MMSAPPTRSPHPLLASLCLAMLCASCQLHVGSPTSLSPNQRIARALHMAEGCDLIASDHLLRSVASRHQGSIPALLATLSRYLPPADDPSRCATPSLLSP